MRSKRGKPLFLPPRQRFVEPFVGVQQGPPSILAPFLRILFPSLLPSLWTMPIPLAWRDGKRKEQWPFLHFEPPLRARPSSRSRTHGPFVEGGVSWRPKLYPLLRGRWKLSRSTIYIGVLHPLPHMHNHNLNLEFGGTMNKGHLPPHSHRKSLHRAPLRRFDIVNKGEWRSFHHSVLRPTFIRNSEKGDGRSQSTFAC